MRDRLGAALTRAGLITERQLRSAIAEHERSGERLGAVLVRLRMATEQEIASALAVQLGLKYVDLNEAPPDPAVVTLIPKAGAERLCCVALSLDGNVLRVAMADPLAFGALHELEASTGYRIQETIATPSAIVKAIDAGYIKPRGAEGNVPQDGNVAQDRSSAALSGPRGGAEPQPLLADDERALLVDRILGEAARLDATDIHLEPMPDRLQIRYRVDGVLRDAFELPLGAHEEVVARLKILSGLDVAERLLPQAGRIRLPADRDGTQYRIATIRTVHGEKVVLRLFGRGARIAELSELGMSPHAIDALRALLQSPSGLLIVAGPAASGRTTTLYAIGTELLRGSMNVLTIEDPVEREVPGLTQTQVDDRIGLTFTSALRSALLQDVDAIIVGDLGAANAAVVAMHAASNGRRVIGGLHADDAASALIKISQLIDESSSRDWAGVVGVVAQRLVGRLCEHCRSERAPSPEELKALNPGKSDPANVKFYGPVGCAECDYSGFRGRTGIFEVMRVTGKIGALVAAGASRNEIRDAAAGEGMVTLGEDGLAKARLWVTTPEAALRVVRGAAEPRLLCGGCGAALETDFAVCPRCGWRRGESCARCGRALQPDWTFCPYCASKTEDAIRPARRGIIRAIRNPDPTGTV